MRIIFIYDKYDIVNQFRFNFLNVKLIINNNLFIFKYNKINYHKTLPARKFSVY